MNSINELLDMIATKAIEDFGAGDKKDDSKPSLINYDLRLVRYEDGRMEWKD